MEKWEDYEKVTVWSYVGLVFMAVTSIATACCTVWMFL